MNLQFIRELLDKDINIHNYVNNNYWNNRLLFSNFWFIVVPENHEYVYKYYISKDFLSKYKVSNLESFYFQENSNYELFTKNNINVPNFQFIDIIKIGDYSYYKSKLENVRNYSKKFDSISQIPYVGLANLLKSIHSLHNDWFIHWNIHHSNFYLDKNWELWVFDLVWCRVWIKEKDLSRIYIYSWFDDSYLNDFLYHYGNDIDISKLYKYTIFDLADNLKHADMSQEYKDTYKKMINQLTRKLSQFNN